MSVLGKKFKIRGGYPNGSALDRSFSIKKVGGVAVELPGGTLVTQEAAAAGTVVDKATTPDLSGADPIQVWLVVEGNDDYSGAYVEKVHAVLLGSGVSWETDQYTAGVYTPGTAVSFSAGKLKVKAANEQIVGYVLEDKTATDGVIVVANS